MKTQTHSQTDTHEDRQTGTHTQQQEGLGIVVQLVGSVIA